MHKALLYPASYLLLVYQTHELCAHAALQVDRFRNRTLLLHLERICVCQHHLQGIVYPDSLVLINYTVDVPLTLQEMRGHFGGIAVVRSSHAVRCVCREWKHNALLLLLAIDIVRSLSAWTIEQRNCSKCSSAEFQPALHRLQPSLHIAILLSAPHPSMFCCAGSDQCVARVPELCHGVVSADQKP